VRGDSKELAALKRECRSEDVSVVRKAGQRSKPPVTGRLLVASDEISAAPPERADFLHSVLCQVGLPRRKVDEPRFERTSGNVSLLIEAGRLWTGRLWLPQPLPYGTRPRLALVHLCAEAIRARSPVVEVGNSVREFLLRLGINTGGREYARFQAQMKALAACSMTLGIGLETIAARPIERFSAWASVSDHQRSLWPGVVELSPRFFTSLSEHAVPLDPRALAKLSHSALALDVYTWLAHRLHRVTSPSGTRLSWANLREQFGQEYRDPKDFKREMLKAMRAVSAVYPDARVEQVMGGLILMPSPPPVPRTMVVVAGK
jgi:hypothetical protein